MKELLKLYDNLSSTFREQVDRDLETGAVWFNPEEFFEFHDIEGEKVLSVLVGDHRNKTVDVRIRSDEAPEGITKSRSILFIREQDIEAPKADGYLRVDGRLYTVSDSRLVQGKVWRVVLEANVS